MARRKETIWQNDFSLGAIRPESLERDDTALIQISTKEALNTIALTTGQVEIRPGTVHLNSTAANEGIEVDLGSGKVFDLHLTPTGLFLYDVDGVTEYSTASTTWTAITGKWGTFTFDDIEFWVIPDPDSSSILIGSQYFPVQVLTEDSAGTWAFGEMAFSTALSGAIGQPYWRYHPSVTITPSALTGTITVTASDPIFLAAHAGMAIRYVDREILFTTYVSSTVMNATVTEELPSTLDLTVASVSGYQVGEAVEHDTLGGKGIITAIAGSIITVLPTSSFDGFTGSGKLTAPNANQTISLMATATPAATFLWDMQLQSPVLGYAGHATRHQSRVILSDFPGAPQAFAVSVAGNVADFTMGPEDADGFVETVGADLGGRLKYTVSAEDLLFFTTKGLYYQQTRDGSAITPKTIRPIRFSRIGCASVRPVAVDDGAIFVDAVGEQIYAAILAGDIYRSWSAKQMSRFHDHLINAPTRIGSTSSGSEKPEHFIYVINADGTTAVAQWDREESKVSWRPWQTDGTFIAIYQAFGKTLAVVDRTINAVSVRFRERFEYDVTMDCVAAVWVDATFPEGQSGVVYYGGVTALATHLTGHTATVYMERWDLGDKVIDGSGKPLEGAVVLTYPDNDRFAEIGLPFTMRIVPWERRSVDTQRGVREIKRTVQMFISVHESTQFTMESATFGAYRVGEDLTVPPPLRTTQYKVTRLGKDDYDDFVIQKDRPGPWRMTKLGYRVTV